MAIDERIGLSLNQYQRDFIKGPTGFGPERVVFGEVALEAALPTDAEVEDLARRLLAALRADDPCAEIQDEIGGSHGPELNESRIIDGHFCLTNIARSLLSAS